MKICVSCGCPYDDNEAYCHKCEKPLKGKNLKVKPSDDDKIIVQYAQRKIASLHHLVAFFYIAIFAVICYPGLVGSEEFNWNSFIVLPFIMLHFTVANGVVRGVAWSKPVSTIIAFIMLFGFPVGTFIGFKMLSELNRKEWLYFESYKFE